MRIVLGLRLACLCLFLPVLTSACAKVIENDFNTVIQNDDRGSTEVVAAPLQDTAALMIGAVDESSYKVHSAARRDSTLRMLVSQGTTLTSWGEVGRIDLTPLTDSSTEAYVRVEHIKAVEGHPSAEGPILSEWMASVAAYRDVLAANRDAGAYPLYTVNARELADGTDAADDGGVALGLLFGGFVGAAMASDAEEARGKITPYRYALVDGERDISALSFMPVEIGRCVAVANTDFTPFEMTAEEEPGTVLLLPARAPADC